MEAVPSIWVPVISGSKTDGNDAPEGKLGGLVLKSMEELKPKRH
jgi:hypothetical protein